MLLLGQEMQKKTLKDAGLLLQEILAKSQRKRRWRDRLTGSPGKPHWRELIPPKDPHWLPDSERWLLKVKTGWWWWMKESIKLSEVAAIPVEEIFAQAFNRRHPILRTRGFLFTEQDGVYPSVLPNDENALGRLAGRPLRLIEQFQFASRGSAHSDANHQAIFLGVWCQKTSSELDRQVPDRDVRGRGRFRINLAYRSVGLRLNSFGCQALGELHARGFRSPMRPAMAMIDNLAEATGTLQRAEIPFTLDIAPAWAILASGLAVASAMKFIAKALPQDPPARTGERGSPVETQQGVGDATLVGPGPGQQKGDASIVQIWRSNTQERLGKVAGRIRNDERLRPIVELINILLVGETVDQQWQASKGVEVLEFMQQAWIAHRHPSVKCEVIWSSES
jgi:hypothetical protein